MYRRLLRYNARICTSVGPWIIVVPVAATMLVLFALMAMTSLIRESTPVLVLELLGPLLMAFVGANLLRPEYQYNALETVLTRPVSFRVIVMVRMVLAGLAVLALQALLCLYMRVVMDKPFSPGLALLSAAVSMGFLAAVATAVTAAWRSPTLGFVAAAVFWVLDVALGAQLNPLITMHGYAGHLAEMEGIFEQWWVSKIVLAGLAIVLAVVAARLGTRPVGQRNLRLWARTGLGLVVLALVYIGSGAAYKVEWGRRNEGELLNHSRMWYQQAFKVYGPLPVAYVLGPAFPRLIGYRGPWTQLATDPERRVSDRRYDEVQQLKVAAFGYPNSRWNANALYELGRMSLSDAEEEGGDETRELGMKCLEQVAADHPGSPFAPPALERLAVAYEQGRRRAEAEEAVDRLVTLYPASPSTLKAGDALLARLVSEGRWHDAADLTERLAAVAAPDDRPLLLEQLGNILAVPEVARYTEAAEALTTAVETAEEQARAAVVIEDPDAEVVNRMRALSGVRDRARTKLEELKQAGLI